MTTMTAGNSEGIYGRCDNKCHGARHPKCHCLCGGRYHGANHRDGGLRGAMEEFESEVIEHANKEAAARGWNLKVKNIVELFAKQSSFLEETP